VWHTLRGNRPRPVMLTRFERVSFWSACGLEPQEPPDSSGVWHTLRGNRPRPVIPTRFKTFSF
ncbi:MAG: hypothetical protein M1140_11665, partial [Chloroflexi bacterium]|nr:hypothetical protein [Chloroflexota bacterium]